ncbi:MAG: hypothetical protein BWX86_01981 [Verrucomicrobia bacterium ADurb.Bin122]|nr:MAG: hypothetical protein BWX86_01981 [Verrucomicrobia bacterium ADurb.Bin122]
MVPGAGGEVDHEVAAAGGEVLDGIELAVEAAFAVGGARPHVFTDGQSEAQAVDFDDGGGGGGFEVAVLVEDVVAGEEAFVGDGDDLAVVAEGGGVEKGAAEVAGIGLDGAEDGRDLSGGGGDFGEAGAGVVDETAFEQQIARRVAADDELGEHDELRALSDEGVVGVEDEAAIAREVADGRVELSEADAHGKAGR